MKGKHSRLIRIGLIMAAGILVCFWLFYLMDNVFNGSFVDWFTINFMRENYYPGGENGTDYYVYELNWYELKFLLLRVFILNVLFWLGMIVLVSHIREKRQVRASIEETGWMISLYMKSGAEASEIFPKEYAGVSAQMAEIRAMMQRHEQLLKEEASRKNDLIAYLAHDLKTPLTSVIGYLSLLDEAPDMPKLQKEKYIHITLDKAQRLEKLINEFFEITRYNLQQIVLEKETIDLYYMMVQMTDEFYPVLNAHGNTVELQMDENLTVYGDSMKLARVFNNILKNAVAYSYAQTAIVIAAQAAEREVVITFSNRGKTIPAQKLESIFEKFFRLDDARATNTGGAGLGLAIAKEIVTLHGGSITAESQNELTTFTVRLPAENQDRKISAIS